VDACDEVNDSCVNTPDDAFCDDGLFCTGAESCDPVDGCVAISACPPMIEGCVTRNGECDEVNDTCIDVPDDALCDNGVFCDGAETCDLASTECLPGTPVDCDDGIGCTQDSCNESAQACDNLPDDALCDDGQFCNGAETCDPSLDCQPGTAIECPPGEVCDEDLDQCVPAAECTVDADCDDSMFCNGAETCVAGTCQPGTPVDCDDGVDCTVDACDEVNDSCVNTPDDAFCDDGLFCTGAESCDPEAGCVAISACPPFVDGCVIRGGECDEENDTCIDVPDDALCDNGMFCDGAETCDLASTECLPGTPPCDPDTEFCNEEADICEPTGEIVDIDIYKFQVSRQVVLQRGQDGSSSERRLGHTVKIKLWVDKPMLIDGPRPATVTGVDEAGNVIYTYTMMVDDMLVDEPTLFRFPEYRPMMPGMILWTASIADDDPDIDGATATTMVVE
jgi:hypothetical protein